MAKKCVFCGQTPKNKNREHVIPQWLIRLTGREKEYCAECPGAPEKNIPFMRFTVPACTDCNSRYSDWEAQVKSVIEKILADAPITAAEMDLLLDWFDKVRVGLWYAFYYLNPSLYDFEPNICVDNRIAAHDRMLIVERLDTSGRGILIDGVGTPVFVHSPSAFQMVINNYSFSNISTTNLVSRKLGFPTIGNLTFEQDGVLSGNLIAGTNKAVTPIVRSINPLPNQTVIYQPMFTQAKTAPEYDNDYVRAHSVNFAAGHGGIFYQQNCGPLKYMEPHNKIHLYKTKALPWEQLNDIARRTYNVQTIINQNNQQHINFADKSISDAVRHKMQFNSKVNMLLSHSCNSK